jgi:predicted AAA+ superfamily ATPase
VKARLAHETNIPEGTITSYLDLLTAIGLIDTIAPWTTNLTKRETGRGKVLVADSAVALRLARLTDAQLHTLEYGEAFGAALEAFVYSELNRQQTWSRVDWDLFHYRDRDGDEVDVVIELYDGTVIGLEVKASTSFSARSFAGLTRLRDRLGDRFRAGLVLNTGSAGYRYADRLWAVPVSALWTIS